MNTLQTKPQLSTNTQQTTTAQNEHTTHIQPAGRRAFRLPSVLLPQRNWCRCPNAPRIVHHNSHRTPCTHHARATHHATHHARTTHAPQRTHHAHTMNILCTYHAPHAHITHDWTHTQHKESQMRIHSRETHTLTNQNTN